MANQPNSNELPYGWHGYDEIRRDWYCGQRDQTTGEWKYKWRSELDTPRSASNENPLAISATQSYPRAGNPEQPSYSAGANGYAYDTEAITTGLESMPANLEEPRQPRRRGSERPHASRRGTDMWPNVAGAQDRQRRPSAALTQPQNSTHAIQPSLIETVQKFNYRETPESYQSQLSAAQVGYGGSQGGFPQSAQGARQPPDRFFQWSPPQQTQNGYFAVSTQAGISYPQSNLADRAFTQPLSTALGSEDVAGPSNNELDYNQSQFKRIMPNPHKFFVVGKVFMMFHIDNAGDKIDPSGKDFTTVSHGEVAHHTFRRFIVVEECSGEHFCHCLAITTYGGRGVTKPGVNPNSHTMIYTGHRPPPKRQGEERMSKDPLQMIPCSPEHKLDPLSRVNLRRQHPIEHNWKVQEIGQIADRSIPKLLSYWRSTKDGNR